MEMKIKKLYNLTVSPIIINILYSEYKNIKY